MRPVGRPLRARCWPVARRALPPDPTAARAATATPQPASAGARPKAQGGEQRDADGEQRDAPVGCRFEPSREHPLVEADDGALSMPHMAASKPAIAPAAESTRLSVMNCRVRSPAGGANRQADADLAPWRDAVRDNSSEATFAQAISRTHMLVTPSTSAAMGITSPRPAVVGPAIGTRHPLTPEPLSCRRQTARTGERATDAHRAPPGRSPRSHHAASLPMPVSHQLPPPSMPRSPGKARWRAGRSGIQVLACSTHRSRHRGSRAAPRPPGCTRGR